MSSIGLHSLTLLGLAVGAGPDFDPGMEAILRNLLGPFPPSMTQGFDVAVHVVIFTTAAGVGGIALLRAGGFC